VKVTPANSLLNFTEIVYLYPGSLHGIWNGCITRTEHWVMHFQKPDCLHQILAINRMTSIYWGYN